MRVCAVVTAGIGDRRRRCTRVRVLVVGVVCGRGMRGADGARSDDDD